MYKCHIGIFVEIVEDALKPVSKRLGAHYFEKTISLPFPPYPELEISGKDMHEEIIEVTYSMEQECFYCVAVPITMNECEEKEELAFRKSAGWSKHKEGELDYMPYYPDEFAFQELTRKARFEKAEKAIRDLKAKKKSA